MELINNFKYCDKMYSFGQLYFMFVALGNGHIVLLKCLYYWKTIATVEPGSARILRRNCSQLVIVTVHLFVINDICNKWTALTTMHNGKVVLS